MKVEGGLSEKKGTIERRDKRRGVNKHLYMYENIMMKRIKMYPTKIRKLKKKSYILVTVDLRCQLALGRRC
jgi:hypothetical protein